MPITGSRHSVFPFSSVSKVSQQLVYRLYTVWEEVRLSTRISLLDFGGDPKYGILYRLFTLHQ